MRGTPEIQFVVRRFLFWQLGVLTVAAVGVAALAAWVIARQPVAPPLTWSGAAGVAIAGCIVAVTLVRLPAWTLHWDGRAWHAAAAGRADAFEAARVVVAIDLGAWMLLRFDPVARRAAPLWLPVQRRGLETQWHALRCAVHAAAPTARDPSQAGR
jgi:hypothetical protein